MQRDQACSAGLLHGVPFAVKDIFDTADFPTEYNSPIYRGRRPSQDAECVARARVAGAVLIGKTVTSEFAHTVLGPTANPVNIRYSPGGSSSGSAAAVAAGFVPIALGTQTGGSAIRPASYCGVFGFKPTFGRLSMAGIKPVAPSLDTVGLFARNMPDLETFFRALTPGIDLVPTRSLRRCIAVCRASGWGAPDPGAEAVLASALESLATGGYEISTLELPSHFDSLPASCMTLLNAELARSLAHEYAHHRSLLSDETRQAIESGRAITAADLKKVYELQRASSVELNELFENFEALLTFSARGKLHWATKMANPVFNRVWTMLHVPCINIPAGRGPNRLPIGLQLIGRRGRDLELLNLARQASEVRSRPPFFADSCSASRQLTKRHSEEQIQ